MLRIITDSSSDLSLQRCEELGVEIIPLRVHFGEECFKANVEISNEEFYERLSKAESLPTTSQITPAEFEDIFRPYVEAGDEIVCLFISSKMSGTYQSALVAKGLVGGENIHIVDTLTVTFALALLVEEAVKMRDRGFSAAEIAEQITSIVPRNHLWAVIEDLKYLKMGGRLSATSAFFASILGICPIITIKDGLVETVGKARGKKAAYKLVENLIQKNEISNDYGVTLGHSNSPEGIKNFEEYFHDTLKKRDVTTCDIGSIVGTHVGPNACGLSYIRR
ncbi:DegV family protein [Scatolibacter rhodanostii]|uniref:DegV family protein n=1 Tax=Scatolibacter rhodanostii TaxID=2014781 RepID=UPI000C086289|nr:DegV family protein [Scatolibacter rhodanostii]